MSGNHITVQQFVNYKGYRKLGHTQETAAAKAGMSESTGKRLDKNGFKDKQPRDYKTRKDPLVEVWDSELVPMLESKPALSATTLLDYLDDKYPGIYNDKILRTLQRRVKDWKAKHGPDKEIFFEQRKIPGSLCLSDFTEFKDQTITIQGVIFNHKLYHFRLAYSGWSYIKVIYGGESFTALSENLQNALWRLGGVPQEHRTDSLSAAYKNISSSEKLDVTKLYSDLCTHYNIKPTRNNLGCKHENGSIESSHGHMKKKIKQALLIRGSYDFNSVEEYQQFIDMIVQKYNRKNLEIINYEKKHLQDLPLLKTCDYSTLTVRVASTSTFKVKNNVYSVPSRLIGETLKVHLYDDKINCYLGADYLFSYKREVVKQGQIKKHINYRHLLPSLIKKPGAFARSSIKEDILPSAEYAQIWKYLENKCEKNQACKILVGILQVAATISDEDAVSRYVLAIIAQNKIPYVELIKKNFIKDTVSREITDIQVEQHDLESYNLLLNHEEVDNASNG